MSDQRRHLAAEETAQQSLRFRGDDCFLGDQRLVEETLAVLAPAYCLLAREPEQQRFDGVFVPVGLGLDSLDDLPDRQRRRVPKRFKNIMLRLRNVHSAYSATEVGCKTTVVVSTMSSVRILIAHADGSDYSAPPSPSNSSSAFSNSS